MCSNQGSHGYRTNIESAEHSTVEVLTNNMDSSYSSESDNEIVTLQLTSYDEHNQVSNNCDYISTPWAEYDSEPMKITIIDQSVHGIEPDSDFLSSIYDEPATNYVDDVIDVSKEESLIPQPALIDDMFTVVFTMDAINLIKTFSECLEPHAPFRDFIELLEPILLSELERFFEQKLAMYISLNLKSRMQILVQMFKKSSGPVGFNSHIYTITVDDVTCEVTGLIHNVLNICYKAIPPEGTIANMLDGYPIFVLSKACNTNMLNAHIMGESMRRFIQIRKTYKRWLPIDLQMATISNCDLVGASGSPLVQTELLALYRYLGTENSMYVTILLNCLFELGQQSQAGSRHGLLGENEKVLGSHYMDPRTIIKLCKSTWLCLFLSTVNCNIIKQT